MRIKNYGRFVGADAYANAATALPLQTLRTTAQRSSAERTIHGQVALQDIIEFSCAKVPFYRSWRQGRLGVEVDELPILDRRSIHVPSLIAEGSHLRRWNRTSGSTNVPVVTPLGEGHEKNQIAKWFRHWSHFGVPARQNVTHVVPRSYRLRAFGSSEIIDVAGEHRVTQIFPDSTNLTAAEESQVVMGNPHLLESIFRGAPIDVPVLVTSYEQRVTDSSAVHGVVQGDVYGLSEVGDVAYQRVGAADWQIHSDMVYVEPAETPDLSQVFHAEILVTDLTNFQMPLLRYRTGDIGLFSSIGGSTRLLSIAGRRIAAQGTCLAGLDLFSCVMPHLLAVSRAFRLQADDRRALVNLPDANARELTRLRMYLAPYKIEVSAGRDQDASLRDVLVCPSFDERVT